MKIINVSYRLPISLQKENGKVHISNTAGGLSSAILSYIEKANGDKTIEVKLHLANNCDICKTHIIKEDIDFILAIGDAKTDEDMFALLTESHHITLKVGDSYSKANYQLDNTELVKSFLSQLSTAH